MATFAPKWVRRLSIAGSSQKGAKSGGPAWRAVSEVVRAERVLRVLRREFVRAGADAGERGPVPSRGGR